MQYSCYTSLTKEQNLILGTILNTSHLLTHFLNTNMWYLFHFLDEETMKIRKQRVFWKQVGLGIQIQALFI